MATLELSDEQVLDLVKQLPRGRQDELLRSLLSGEWSTWRQLSVEGQAGVRNAATARGLNWDAITDQERQDFVDEVVHEDRACRR